MSVLPFTGTFVFSSTTAEPPASKQIRLDTAAPYADASKLWIANLTNDDRDLSPLIRRIAAGAPIYLQDRDEAARAIVLDVTAAPIQKAGYVEIPIVCREYLGDLRNAQPSDLYAEAVYGSSLPVTGSGTPGAFARWTAPNVIGDAAGTALPAPVYVTLPQAKDHLHIKDSAHDPDVQLKLDQAAAQIVDYLESGRTRYADPALPEPGTPGGLIIQSAVLELVAGLYEHRGDDFGINDTDAKLWDAIRRKLARLRDPAVA